jgi:hypothetical protein
MLREEALNDDSSSSSNGEKERRFVKLLSMATIRQASSERGANERGEERGKKIRTSEQRLRRSRLI